MPISLSRELMIRMDPQDLQELVGNLLENALRWAATTVTLSAGEDGEECWIEVADDGRGMSEPQRHHVMARGARLDEQEPGSGLGLAIVSDLVDLYGGRLVLAPSSLGGLAARIYLPSGPLPKG
ncbi:ATP-binding protein [Halomonas tibetensis]|uniref:histidine kinase n=1 Tax=Halomonas tibetensis TaxID=2259590 RepID=A0ABV7B439_9GAMM